MAGWLGCLGWLDRLSGCLAGLSVLVGLAGGDMLASPVRPPELIRIPFKSILLKRAESQEGCFPGWLGLLSLLGCLSGWLGWLGWLGWGWLGLFGCLSVCLAGWLTGWVVCLAVKLGGWAGEAGWVVSLAGWAG